MDDPADNLPQDEMRSEQFVEEVTKYFDVLDVRASHRFAPKTHSDL